jgi:hypothetical protein
MSTDARQPSMVWEWWQQDPGRTGEFASEEEAAQAYR